MKDCGSACICDGEFSRRSSYLLMAEKRGGLPSLGPFMAQTPLTPSKGWPGTGWLSSSICSVVEWSVLVFKFLWLKHLWVFQSFTYNNLRGTLWLSDPIKHDWNIEGRIDLARIKGSNPLSPNVESSIEGSALELVSYKMAKERKSNSLLFHTVKILLRSRKHWKGRVLLYTDAMLTLMNYSG